MTTNLQRDQRGAILFIGLFTALSLIGALWVVIGIGNAMMLHDQGQEAADAAALSSAALHARSMNASAAMNFVMLVMVGAYLSFSVIADIALVAAAQVVGVGFAEKSAREMGAEAKTVFITLVQFEQNMGASIAALDSAQTGLAVGGPALGTPAGREVAAGRQATGLTLGWSNFPATRIEHPGERPPFGARPMAPNPPLDTPKSCTKGGELCDMANRYFPVLKSPPKWNAGPMSGRSLGLPMAAEPTSSLCVRAGMLFFKDFGDAINPFNLGDGAKDTMDTLKATDKKLPLAVHCSDDVNRNTIAPMVGLTRARDIWTKAGPMRNTAANGDQTMRVVGWATTESEAALDESVRRVKLAAYDLTGGHDKSVIVYHAQAEFFYACNARWDTPACNAQELGASGVGYERALYGMNWRARLAREHAPARIFGGSLNNVLQLGGEVVNRAGASTEVWKRVAEDFRGQDRADANSLH